MFDNTFIGKDALISSPYGCVVFFQEKFSTMM